MEIRDDSENNEGVKRKNKGKRGKYFLFLI